MSVGGLEGRDDQPTAKIRGVSDVSVQHAPAKPSTAIRLLVAVVVLLVLLVGTLLYQVRGARAMESACSLDGAHGTIHNSVTYRWSWNPLGFQCTYDNGQTETSIWP